MKTRLVTLLLLSLTFGNLYAQPKAVQSWTSNDHHTIQARFIGVGARSVLIEKDGIVFNVPFTRLSAQSIAQAKQMGADPTTAKTSETAALVTAAPARPETPTVIAAVKPVMLAKAVVSRPSLPADPSSPSVGAYSLTLAGKTASATGELPYAVQRAIEAGNFLQTKPYKWGGGHSRLMDTGYDCSGSVSHVLIQAGLLKSALTSSGFARYGLPGPGKWITIYAGSGHAFMTICGLRLDTGGRGGRGESGPRWSKSSRGSAGWTLRHPPGF